MDLPRSTLGMEIASQHDPPTSSSADPQPGSDAEQEPKPKPNQSVRSGILHPYYWSKEEIERLERLCTPYENRRKADDPPYLINKHWDVVAAQFEGRSADACKRRWVKFNLDAAKHRDVNTNTTTNKAEAKKLTSTSVHPNSVSASLDATGNTSSVQPEKASAYKNETSKNETPKPGGGSGSWGAEEDAHYIRIVEDERRNSPHIDATNKTHFWEVVQQKLGNLGYVRSLASLRSRWNYKKHQAASTGWSRGSESSEGSPGTGITGHRDRKSRQSLHSDTRTKEWDTDIVYTEGGGEVNRFSDNGRNCNTRSLRKRNRTEMTPGFINLDNININFDDDESDDELVNCHLAKKARVDGGLQLNSEPPHVQSKKATPVSVEALVTPMAPPSLAPARSPNPDDHAFAVRKIATFNNDIQILGAQRNGHLMILEDVETRLVQLRQHRAGVEKKLKALADQERELSSERNSKTREIEEVEKKIKETEKGRDVWTATLNFC